MHERADEHAVFVFVPARGDVLKLSIEWEDELTELVAGLGEVDGSEVGEGWLKLFIYGPNADAVVNAIWPFARAKAPAEAYIVVRRGPPGCDEETMSLSANSS